jgi:hypothetical protein
MQISSPSPTSHTISAQIIDHRSNISWTITDVYGPQGELEKKMFIKRIKGCQANGKHKMADLGRLQSNLQGPGQEQWEIEQEAHA